MAVSIDEEVDIRVAFQVVFGVQHQMLFVFAHVVGFFSVYSFQAAMLGPRQSKFYAPAGMKGGE